MYNPPRCSSGWRIICGLALLSIGSLGIAGEVPPFEALRSGYDRDVRPLLEQLCLDCHSTDAKEGELDLERFANLTDVRRDPSAWQKVVEMLASGEMPPDDSPQPRGDQRQQLLDWTRQYLDAEALAGAGDPGSVVLRRLNNAEYTYTVRDLTGVESLNPAGEFPTDGAAGEGFTNTGGALAMSPALVQKYLDAGKEIASHAVLLPDGFRFSPGTTRRDWANEILVDIRAIYARHTSGNRDVGGLDKWAGGDPTRATQHDGRVELPRYFAALVRHRERLNDDSNAAQEIAKGEGLNAPYLRHLAETLVSPKPRSILLESLRRKFNGANLEDAAALATEVRAWQDVLWKFNAVGHLGIIRPWQEPVDPVLETITLRQPIGPSAEPRDPSRVFLVAGSAGDESPLDVVLWQRPRIEFKDRPPILLRDVPFVVERIRQAVRVELGRTDRYLAAVAQVHASHETIEQLAAERELDRRLLAKWCRFAGIRDRTARRISGHFQRKLSKVHGHQAINGWGVEGTPSLLTNRSDEPIGFLTLTIPPRGVTVHPSPAEQAVVHWRSPIDGTVRIAGKVADADDKCGNGAAWALELRRMLGTEQLATGAIDNGRQSLFEPESTFDVRKGDVVSLSVGARDGNHGCDTTHIELEIKQVGGQNLAWSLADDVVERIHAANPLSDSLGNPATWHFCSRGIAPKPRAMPAAGSALSAWREAVVDAKSKDEIERLAADVQALATQTGGEPSAPPDQALRRQLTDWDGPLAWIEVAADDGNEIDSPTGEEAIGIDVRAFGRHPQSKPLDAASLVVTAPSVLDIRLPAALVAGGTFVVDATLDPHAGRDGCVQVQLLNQPPGTASGLIPGQPIVARNGSESKKRVVAAYRDFRDLLPAAMCHARIVPVDEVVTLVLYHREDAPLARLMLDTGQRARLERLWDELQYVSQDALRIEVSLEQLLEFSTQDADPRRFDPVRQPIAERAAAFRERLVATESAHLEALLELASRANRRPLSERESGRLRSLYHKLRGEGLPHEEAFRLTLARVLAAPAFLYRLEAPAPGSQAGLVSDWELASRLSYFLWSSLPDARLRAAAARGQLHDRATLLAETRRMLKDSRARRMAIQFACQWLQIRDFDQHDEKSEQHFPEFVALRGEMYEESIRFFSDLFQNDGSILSILDADHTFVNEALAAHYGIPGVVGEAWRRVDGVKRFSRGGILAQAATLAKQSGASRTSPILRGNWISETLLGERLPRPPKDVPQLPDTVPQNLTERQLIEKHSSQAGCAKCHARIDPYGFALERFDAVGRFRSKDAAGHPIDTRSTLVDGTKIEGIDGLRRYLLTKRRDDFLHQFCRKLLGYALGRGVQLSDKPLLDEISDRLAQNDHRFSQAIESIILSDQFRSIRGIEHGAIQARKD